MMGTRALRTGVVPEMHLERRRRFTTSSYRMDGELQGFRYRSMSLAVVTVKD